MNLAQLFTVLAYIAALAVVWIVLSDYKRGSP
jgi:hypothetical protein